MGLLATLPGLEMRRLDEGGYGADINERFVATMRTPKCLKAMNRQLPAEFGGNKWRGICRWRLIQRGWKDF